MKNILALFILITLFACNRKDPYFDPAIYDCTTSVVNTHPKATDFQSFLEEKVKEGLPGISMLIETPEGIWTGAAGVSELPFQTPMKACNVHKIGSSTKVFTAALIFKLYEDGLLEFDDLISKHLPSSLLEEVANHEEATIRSLLTHSSGIPDYLDINYSLNYYDDLSRIWTPKEELSMIYGEEAVFAVGEKVDYSNSNYLLLGMIATHITEKTADELFQEYIFSPLDLMDTYFNVNGDLPAGLVRGYADENGKGNFIDITDRSFARGGMAGGMSSTVEDLHRCLKATWTTNVLITDSTKNQITTLDTIPFLSPEKFEYEADDKVQRIKGIGLCWFQYDTEYGICYGHDGGFDGRRSVFRYFPDTGVSIVYLVNGSGASIKPLLRDMRRNQVVELVFD